MRKLAICLQNSDRQVTPIQTIEAIKKAGYQNIFILCYYYLNMSLEEFYKKSYEIGEKLSNMWEN